MQALYKMNMNQMFGEQSDIKQIEALIKKGVDLNHKDKFGRTLIYDAIVKGFINVVKLFCNEQIDLNIHDKEGKTPLHFSAIYNNVEITKLLLEYGAIVDSVDSDGNTPLSDAVFYSKGFPDNIILLLKSGANPDKENNYGISPKELAETINNYDVKQYFNV